MPPLAVVVVAVGVLVVVVLVLHRANEVDSPARPVASTPAANRPRDPVIPGLTAVDVHGNFEGKGFTLKRFFGGEQKEWTCERDSAAKNEQVSAFGSDSFSIWSVKATFTNLLGPESATGELAKDFLGYVASVPYENASPAEAREWVKNHIDQDEAKTVIAGVRFEVYAKVPRMRVLRIVPAARP